jgi:hypothetical protein
MKTRTFPIEFTRPFWGGLLIEHMPLDGGKIVVPSMVLVVAGIILARKGPGREVSL